MHSNLLAAAFALLSALIIAWGTVIRHRIAEQAPADGSLSGSPFISALSRPMWWLGTGCALFGYALQVVALGFGTLLVVQPILVLSLMFTLPLSARYDGKKMARDELGWATALTISVGILVIMGDPLPGNPQPPLERWLPALAVGVATLGIFYLLSRRAEPNKRALLLGTITGGIYGYVAVLSKATVDVIVHEGLFALLTTWQGYSLLAGAMLGTVVQQYAFNAGQLKNSLPAMTIVEPIFAFALGYAVLGEKFQVSGWNWAWMALSLLVMILSTIALSSRRVG